MRKEFTGMLPAAIAKFEELMNSELNPTVVKGYDVTRGKDSFFYWGAACKMTCADMDALKTEAEALGIIWLGDGEMAYTKGLTIEDFKTYRVNGDLELMPEEEV